MAEKHFVHHQSFMQGMQGLAKKLAQAFGFSSKANPDGSITITSASFQPQNEPAKKLAAQVLRAKDGKHLVIMRIKITLKCAHGKLQSLAHVHQGRIFDSLIAGETYRCELVRRTGHECVIVSSAKVCERFREIASNKSICARIAEGEFLHQQFERAASPAFN